MTAKRKIMTDADVFRAFGVGPNDKPLRAFISGQRKINGRLYKAIDLIGEALKAGPGKKYDRLIAKASQIDDGAPGDLPGCAVNGWG